MDVICATPGRLADMYQRGNFVRSMLFMLFKYIFLIRTPFSMFIHLGRVLFKARHGYLKNLRFFFTCLEDFKNLIRPWWPALKNGCYESRIWSIFACYTLTAR